MSAPEALSEPLQKGDSISPFRQGAPDWIRHNIPVFPMDSVEKKPLVRPPDRITVKAARDLLEREQRKPRPSVNLAFAPGPRAGVTVIDVDSSDTKWLDRAISRYGETPLMWRTPSGGVHLAYRHNGEKRGVRVIEDEPIDRLAGGICAAPPSRRETGTYHFIAGSLDDLGRLPKIRVEMSKEPGMPAPSSFRPVDGTRNDKLFKSMLRLALQVDTLDDLLDCALTMNGNCVPPLEDAEAVEAATNAWNYQATGNNWCGRSRRAAVEANRAKALVTTLAGGAEALGFLMFLKSTFPMGISFSLGTKGMQDKGLIPGWGWKRYRQAINILLEAGFLDLTKRGGNGPGTPSMYRLTPMSAALP